MDLFLNIFNNYCPDRIHKYICFLIETYFFIDFLAETLFFNNLKLNGLNHFSIYNSYFCIVTALTKN